MVKPFQPHARLTLAFTTRAPSPFRGERGPSPDVHDLEPISSILPRVFAEIVAAYNGPDPHRDDYLDGLAELHNEDQPGADQDIPF